MRYSFVERKDHVLYMVRGQGRGECQRKRCVHHRRTVQGRYNGQRNPRGGKPENSALGYWLRISLVLNGIHRWFGGFLVDAGRKTRRTAAQRVAAFLVRGNLLMLRRLLLLGLLCNVHHEREQCLLCRYNSLQMLATLLMPIVCLLRINTG